MDDNFPATNADDLSPLKPTPQRKDEYGEIILEIHPNKRCQETREEKKEKMPKRKKRGPKLKKMTDTTTASCAGDTASTSSGISSGSNCDGSAIDVKIGMPKVYGRSNSLFGTFGLLDAQKPVVHKIKKEPVDVPKTCDTLNLNINDVSEVELLECSVVLTKNLLIKPEVSGVATENQRVTDGHEKNLVIVADFCVETDTENALEHTMEKEESNRNINREMTIDFPVRNDEEDFSNDRNAVIQKVTDTNVVLKDEFFVKKDSEDVFETIMEQESDTDGQEKDHIILGDLCVETDTENALENTIKKEESIRIINREMTNDLSVRKDEDDFSNDRNAVIQEVTDTNIVLKDEFFVKTDCEDVFETIMEQESDTESNVASANESIEKNDHGKYLNPLNGTEQSESNINEFPAEKDREYFVRDLKRTIKLEKNDADEDIVILKKVCKICFITQTREGFCRHFPYLVE